MPKNRIITPIRNPIKNPIIGGKTEVRTLFENLMFKLAVQSKEESEKCEKELDETKYCIGSVIFSWSFLEAYINSFINNELSQFSTDIGPNDFSRLPTIQKYVIISKLVSGKTFSKEKEPFYSLSLLNKIRNKLIHYEAKMEEVGSHIAPKKLVKQCKDKFKIKEMEPTDELRKILTKECAEWSIKTAVETVRKFEDNVYGKNKHTFLINNLIKSLGN